MFWLPIGSDEKIGLMTHYAHCAWLTARPHAQSRAQGLARLKHDHGVAALDAAVHELLQVEEGQCAGVVHTLTAQRLRIGHVLRPALLAVNPLQKVSNQHVPRRPSGSSDFNGGTCALDWVHGHHTHRRNRPAYHDHVGHWRSVLLLAMQWRLDDKPCGADGGGALTGSDGTAATPSNDTPSLLVEETLLLAATTDIMIDDILGQMQHTHTARTKRAAHRAAAPALGQGQAR